MVFFFFFLSPANNNTPTSGIGAFSPYPQLSIHSHVVSEDESWEKSDGDRLQRQVYHPSEDIRSTSSGRPMEAVFEEQDIDVHHTFPPLSARSSPGSVTPTGTMSSRSSSAMRERSPVEPWSPLTGPRRKSGPSPLGLGSRYNPSPAPSSSQGHLNPGPMHHGTTDRRGSVEPEEVSRYTYSSFPEMSQDRPSPNRTPTPSRHQGEEGFFSSLLTSIKCLFIMCKIQH